jgi:hypothetical protein
MAGVIVLLLAVLGWMFTQRDTGDGGALREGEGELVVTTRLPGARVKVDGKDAGVTELVTATGGAAPVAMATLRMQSGAHVIEVQLGNGEPRVVPVMIRAGVQTAQYVELPDPLPAPKRPAEKTRKK